MKNIVKNMIPNELKNTIEFSQLDEEVEIEFPDENPSGDGSDEELLMEEPFNPIEINIISKQDSLNNLVKRLNHDEIDMNTDFQREAELWTNKQMSRLIESILIRIPLPAFYFDATDEEKWLVVDGLQRLSSIKKFVIDKKLSLNGLEYLENLHGATYNDLPRTYQRRIDECSITLFLIQPGTPDEVKYSIFRRINTGGLTLNFQEIRNALASPRIRRYLQWLSNKEYMKKTISANTKRMQGQELALRFLAFYSMDYLETKKNITVFLDEMMAKLEEMDKEELNHLGKKYSMALKRSWDIFGEIAFEKITVNGETAKRRRKNSTLFEVWTVALARLSEDEMNTLVAKKEIIQKKHVQLITHDEIYFRSITFSTQTKNSYRIRCEKVQELINEVLDA